MSLARITAHCTRRTLPKSWEWARDNIDYSRAPNYDTPYRGPFDPDLMPFWQEPLEAARDANVREIIVLKSSRAGYSENLLLVDLRFTMCLAPEPTMYVTGMMDLSKSFLDTRVKRGMALCQQLRDMYAAATVVRQDVRLPTMDFRATWASSDVATKQDGWARLYVDEVGLCPETTVDMVRRRCAAYPFHHIIFGGSIDPTRPGNPDEDASFKLYEESDKRVWMMPDPKTGRLFAWTLAGVKWPDDIESGPAADLNRVRVSAWYETPDGTRIDEADRMTVARSGRWVVTNPAGIRRGYKVVAAMVPFEDGAFGVLAERFLSAKHRMNHGARRLERHKNTLRTYFAEHWAETHKEEEYQVADATLASRRCDYTGDNLPDGVDKAAGFVFLTADCQKATLPWVARVWVPADDGTLDAYLIGYGYCPSFPDLSALCDKVNPGKVGQDISYPSRAFDVARWMSEHSDQVALGRGEWQGGMCFALRGSATMKATPNADRKSVV